MRCKPPCLAWVNKANHPSNKNRIVSVHPESIQGPRGHMWLTSCNEPMVGVSMIDGKTEVIDDKLWTYDSDLTPINDPGLDTKDTGKDRPIEKVQDKPVVETWEWPNV